MSKEWRDLSSRGEGASIDPGHVASFFLFMGIFHISQKYLGPPYEIMNVVDREPERVKRVHA